MKGINVLDKDIFSYIKSYSHSVFHTGIGFIEEVRDDGTVIVLLSYSKDDYTTRVKCEYLTQSSHNLEVSAPPRIDDVVLVLSMQHKEPSLFTATKPVEINSITGYTLLSCVCVPLGVIKNSAKTRIKVDDGEYSIDTDKIVLNSGTSGASRKGDKVTVTIPAGTVIIGASEGVPNPTPITLEGTIEAGSGTVFIGD